MPNSAFTPGIINVIGPGVSTSSFSGGPPSGASDGDIWIASNVDSAGTRWQFQYNAGSASTYKWEFIGGPPVLAKNNASGTTSSLYTTGAIGSWFDLGTTGPDVVVARGGDYEWHAGAFSNQTTVGDGGMIQVVTVTGAQLDDDYLAYFTAGVANQGVFLFAEGRLNSIAANDTIRMKYAALTGGTAGYNRRRLAVWPVRVS